MENEPKLDMRLVFRNLFNLYALDAKSEEGLDLLSSELLRAGPAYQISDQDLALALKTFAHFEYTENQDCLELLIKQAIRQAHEMDLSCLATSLKAAADLSILNPTLLAISRERILREADRRGNH